MRPRPRRPSLAVAAGLLTAAVLTAACSAPGYEYVRNTSLRTAFKVPRDWTMFDKATLLGTPPGPQASTPDPIRWLVGLDGDPAPSVAHILNPQTLGTEHPQGIALVQEYSFNDRDASSFGSLRDYLFPVTQLLNDPNSARVLAYDDTIDRDGVRGVQIVFQFRESSLAAAQAAAADSGSDTVQRALLGGSGAALLSPDFVTVSQVALVDAETSQVYFLVVLCSATCYDRNRTDIQSIVDSWTVLP